MDIGKFTGGVVTAPFKLTESAAKGATDVAVKTLSFVVNTAFEAIKFGANMFQMMGPLGFMMNPLLFFAAPMIGQAAGGAQKWTDQQLKDFNAQVQGRTVPNAEDTTANPYSGQQAGATQAQYEQTAGTAPQQQFYPPAFDQRMAQPGGFGGQYGNQAIYGQLNPGMAPVGVPFNPAAVYGSNAATATSATMNAGFIPSGNTTFDLANAIANAPTYSPTEMALLSKIKDPEQRAIQELQMQMQKQALLCTVLTNLANMRHEMLKAVAQNLRS